MAERRPPARRQPARREPSRRRAPEPQETVPVRTRTRRGHPAVRVVLGLLLFVVLLFVFVFPTRTYLAQRNETNDVEHQLEVLDRENRRLERQTRKLMTDEEVERIAREEYNLVRPGETPYAVVPEDSTP